MPAVTTPSLQNSLNISQNSQDVNKDFFCQSQPQGPWIWIFYSFFFFILGFPPSVIVMWELCKRRRQNLFNDFFVFNLTVIDLAYLVILPLGVINFMTWKSVEFELLCYFVYSLNVSGRPLLMACICGEYYFAVVHPIIYRNKKRMGLFRKAIAIIIYLFIGCFGGLIASYPHLYSSALGPFPLLTALPVITFCDVSVFRSLRTKDPSGKITVHPQKKRALRTIITSFVMTFTVYLPPAVIFSMGIYTKLSYEIYNCILIFVAVFFTASGCVIMPILYLESIGQLNIRKIMQHMKCKS